MTSSNANEEVRKSPTSQYAELGEDDLIELASEQGRRIAEGHIDFRESRLADLLVLVEALKARRDASAPARRRIGEYLRQQAIVEAKYQRDLNSEYASKTAREPARDLGVIHSDIYAPAVALRVSDLTRLVQVPVRDTKTEFFAEQERRLEVLLERYRRTMPKKQQTLLRCIAKGHYSYSSGWGGGSRYTHRDQGDDCGDRGNGNTLNALLNRKLHTSLAKINTHDSTTLMLAAPKTT